MSFCSLPVRVSAVLVLAASSLTVSAGQWNQWRGPRRDGAATDSPRLVVSLPASGLAPVWISEAAIPGGNDGGWSSPVVAGPRVYVYSHSKQPGYQPPAAKFAPLTEQQKASLTPQQLEEYEQNRQDEQRERRRQMPYDERVYCLDGATGKTVWLNQRTVPGTRFPQSGTPAVIDDRLYLLGAGRVARCVNALTGQDLWSTPLPGEFDGDAVDSSVAVAAGVVVALAGQLVGLDATTGELRWAGPAGKAIGRHSSPVVWQIGGRELIIVNLDGVHTVCIDPSSGNELWRVQSEADRSTPVLVGDRQMLTYGNSRKKGLRSFAISPEGATPQWVYQGAADAGASPVVVGEHCYVQGELRLACVDLQTGKQRWLVELDLGQPRYTSLAAADGKVLYTFDGLLMFAAAADEHRPLVEAKMDKDAVLFEHSQLPPKAGRNKPLECASPALADGRLYLRMRGGVVCYDLRAEPTD